MGSYLRRYMAGDCEAVWRDLLSLGPQVREPSIVEDAMAVAREFASRAWSNAVLLHEKLVAEGYQFASPDTALVRASSVTSDLVAAAEQQLGCFPLSLKAWFEVFHSVDFTQSTDQAWADSDEPMSCLSVNPELVVIDIAAGLNHWDKHHAVTDDAAQGLSHGNGQMERPFLPSGASASNNECKGCRLPELRADAVFYNDGGGDIFFVEEVRRLFKAGGFPTAEFYLSKPRRAKRGKMPLCPSPRAADVLARLKSGLRIL